MENAGRSAALVSRALLLDGRDQRATVVALVGSGNNGGDALVALRSFAAWGHPTQAVLVADRPLDDPLLHGWTVEVVTDQALAKGELQRLLERSDLVLDGILGTGVQGAPRERQAAIIDRLDDVETRVAALDVPSGVDASTGAVPGAAVRADLTISFGAPKLGALLHPARARVGRHVTVEIGFPPLEASDASAVVVTPRWAAERSPVRETDTHKNRVGRVVVVGGGPGMAGAAILAGRAAFRAGAGLVQIASSVENREAIHAALPEAIFVDAADPAALRDALTDADAVAAGPGLGTDEGAAEVLQRVVEVGTAPLALDADALNLAAEGAIDLAAIAAARTVLITPHPGEMGRLMAASGGSEPTTDPRGPGDRGSESSDRGSESSNGGSREELARTEVARAAADRFGCTVLFKGAPSLVASPDGPLAVDTQSSSDLAVAGMGDTLTGVCAALLAQGVGPESAALALYLTGRAARLVSRGPGLTPSDVAERLPDAWHELGEADAVSLGPDGLDLPFVLFDADPAA